MLRDQVVESTANEKAGVFFSPAIGVQDTFLRPAHHEMAQANLSTCDFPSFPILIEVYIRFSVTLPKIFSTSIFQIQGDPGRAILEVADRRPAIS